MKNKKTFLFNLEWFEILAEYPEDVRLEVYEAVMTYASTGSVPELSQLGRMAFSFIRREMDYNTEKYEQTVEKRRQAGSKGGRSKAEKNAAKVQETPVKEAEKEEVKEAIEAAPVNGLTREAELGFFDEIRNDEMFWQEYSVSAKEGVARLRECAESFFAEVLAKEGYHASAGDCKRHLINWVRYSLKNERKNDDKYDRRKGTDVKVHSYEEY